MISANLRAPVQGRAKSKCSIFAGDISRAQRGPHVSSSVAISRQELSQEHSNNRSTLRYTMPRRDGNNSSFAIDIYRLVQSAARATRLQRRRDLTSIIITRTNKTRSTLGWVQSNNLSSAGDICIPPRHRPNAPSAGEEWRDPSAATLLRTVRKRRRRRQGGAAAHRAAPRRPGRSF
jgi:hypothetical protein